MLGQAVAQLVDEVQAANEYHFPFAGVNLESGVYVYKLQVGMQELSRKMLLMKWKSDRIE